MFIQEGLNTHESFINAIKDTRAAVDELNVNGNDAFVYGYVYQFWEQVHEIDKEKYTESVITDTLFDVSPITLLYSLSLSLLLC